MRQLTNIEIEQRALALFEDLIDRQGDSGFRNSLLKSEPPQILARLDSLEARAAASRAAMPTEIPGTDSRGEAKAPPRVGAFELLHLVDRGGMGEVWLGARADGLYDQQVAIKLIQRRALARAATSFDDERRFLARLEHPNIARLIDGGVTSDGLPWLAMEFVKGRPIDEATADRGLAEKVDLFVEAADAVRFAHSRMVAHADIKPSNILVTDENRVKLLDFGVAGLIGAEREGRETARPMTIQFASPQRISGGAPSVADDIFALGRTLELILGGKADADLSAIAGKACAGREQDRYASAADLIVDLECWRVQSPVTAVPNTWVYRTSKFVARYRTGVIVAAAAFAVLLTASVAATANYFSAEKMRARAEQRFDDVRALARYMIFEHYDSLARQPGTVGARAAVAEEAATYLDRLQRGGDANRDLLLETARSYRRLAAIEGLPGTPNLGDPQKAARALDRAQAILSGMIGDGTNDAEAYAELGWINADRWTLHGDDLSSMQSNGDARAFFDKAISLTPPNSAVAVSAQLGKLVTEKSRGYDLIWNADDPSGALPVLKDALAKLRGRSWPAPLQAEAGLLEINLLNRIGDATYYAGDVVGSVTSYAEADALIDRRISREGLAPQSLILKGESAFNISGSLGEIAGRQEEALMVAQAGEAALKRLLEIGPDASAEKKLLVLYGQEALLLAELGRGAEALSVSANSIGLRKQRLASSPADPQRRRDLAIGLAAHAELVGSAGDAAGACESSKEAAGQWAEIERGGNLGALDGRKNVPNAAALKKKYCSP